MSEPLSEKTGRDILAELKSIHKLLAMPHSAESQTQKLLKEALGKDSPRAGPSFDQAKRQKGVSEM